MEDKIKDLIKNIGDLREKLYKLKLDYDLKANKVIYKIRIIEEKILSLKAKEKQEEIPEQPDNNLGVDWIKPEDEEIGVEFLE